MTSWESRAASSGEMGTGAGMCGREQESRGISTGRIATAKVSLFILFLIVILIRHRNEARRKRQSKIKIPCLSGCLTICRARASAKFCFQNRGHAERSSVAGEGGDGTESKHPVRAPLASGRPSCLPRDPSTARRPTFALAALAQDDLRFCQPTGEAGKIRIRIKKPRFRAIARQRGGPAEMSARWKSQSSC